MCPQPGPVPPHWLVQLVGMFALVALIVLASAVVALVANVVTYLVPR